MSLSSEELGKCSHHTLGERAKTGTRLLDFFPRGWVLKHIFRLSDEAVEEIEGQQKVHSDKGSVWAGMKEQDTKFRERLEEGRKFTDKIKALAFAGDGTRELFYDSSTGKAEVEAKVETEKERINREGVEYFRRNLKDALKVPKEVQATWKIKEQLSGVNVGLNDILVIKLNVSDVPKTHVEGFVKKVKDHLASFFDERGLKDRVMWVPVRESETEFSVIHIESQDERDKMIREAQTFAMENTYWNGKKVLTKKDIEKAREILRSRKKFKPPVMG